MNAFAADTEAEAAGLFAGLDYYGEPAVEGVHLRFMEDIQTSRIAIRGSTEAAGTAHFETKQGRIHRAQISIPVHNGHSYIRQVFPVRGQTGAGGFQKDMMGLSGGAHRNGIFGLPASIGHDFQFPGLEGHILPN